MKGETITARRGIANVFAEFYAKLYEEDEGEENTRKNEAETCTEIKRNAWELRANSGVHSK